MEIVSVWDYTKEWGILDQPLVNWWEAFRYNLENVSLQ